MENASKALIIAGAILLSILIISLGILIFNQASGVVNNNAMTEVEVNSFNQKFEQYFGNNVRGANVNALIQAVNTNNMATDDDTKKVEIVDVNKIGITKNQKGVYNKGAKTGNTYIVELGDTTSGGLISEIRISNSGSNSGSGSEKTDDK